MCVLPRRLRWSSTRGDEALRWTAFVVLLLLLSATAATASSAVTQRAQAVGQTLGDVEADFNNDGIADLAVGVPGENDYAGAVNVLYGSAGA
jgi:hypothetical protein